MRKNSRKTPMQAVRDGHIEIVPQSWEKTFFNWMENIQPWCISRQLWWGHRIPAWYGPNPHDRDARVNIGEIDPRSTQVFFENPHIFVEQAEEEVKAKAAALYGVEAEKIRFFDSQAEAITASVKPLRGNDTITLWRDESRRPRHMVLLRPVAFRHARLARR